MEISRWRVQVHRPGQQRTPELRPNPLSSKHLHVT